MGLICNLFSITSKVLKDLWKYSLPIKNHNFWVNLTKDYNYSWKYKLVVMSIDLYMSLYWCTRSCRDTFGNRLYFLRTSELLNKSWTTVQQSNIYEKPRHIYHTKVYISKEYFCKTLGAFTFVLSNNRRREQSFLWLLVLTATLLTSEKHA